MSKVIRIISLTCFFLIGAAGYCHGEGAVVSDYERTNEDLMITEALRPDGKKTLRAVFHVKADPDLVYRTLRDVEFFPEFMPNSDRVEILERGERFQIVKFSGSRGFFRADIVMKRMLSDEERRIEWCLVQGPPREVSGYWQVGGETRDGRVMVAYSNYMDAGRLIPDFVARSLLKDDIRAMVVSIRKRVEGEATRPADEFREGGKGEK